MANRGIVELTVAAERAGKLKGRFIMQWANDGTDKPGVWWFRMNALGTLPDLDAGGIFLGATCAEAKENLPLLPDAAPAAPEAPIPPEPTMAPAPGQRNRRRGPVAQQEE